jgi:thiamine-monophosphate kinase
MDISDGPALDLSRLAAASGVGAVLRLDDIPIAPAAEQWAQQLADGSTPLEHALADGEDFELLLVAPADEARRMLAERPLEAQHGVSLTAVGQIVAEPGLWQVDRQGQRRPLEPRGFLHRGG